MNYFTSTAFLVVVIEYGRHGNYGSTTSIIGVFNTKQRAVGASDEYKSKLKKENRMKDAKIDIVEIKPCVIDEKIISKVYE